MSALGQERTYAVHSAMSALPPIATSIAFFGMFALGQKRTWPALFKNLGGAGEDRMRYRDADPLSGLKIDHKLVLGRRLHRKIGGLLALENAVDVAGGASILLLKISSIRNQTAVSDEQAFEVDCGQSVAGRKLDDQIALNARNRAPRYDQTAITRTRELRNGPL